MNNKLDSFISLCQKDLVHRQNLLNEFDSFMESDFENAYEYFVSKGMIIEVQQQPTDVEICKQIINSILNHKDSSIKTEMLESASNEKEQDIVCLKKTFMKYAIAHYKGIVDPRRVKDILDYLVS